MALINKEQNFMGLPMNIQRGNPIPLDYDSIWYSYDAMAEYARGEGDRGAVAYVGQILTLVDEVNETSEAYIILNESGDLQAVGSATLGDNNTITLENSVLGLKDFGKKFYKYIEETTDEETQEVIAAHYEVQEVDEQNPWKAGLEPKVVLEDNEFVLGWYEPNPTTIEGVNTQVSGIQTTVNSLTETTKELSEKVGSAAETDEEGNVTTPASGLFAELDKKASHEDVESAIAEAVADLDHLKRTTAESKESIDLTAADADQYIYMVPNGDVYDEYMVIEGKLELVGNTSVDLSGKVDKQDGYSLVEDSEIEKLKALPSDAEKNVVNSVNEEEFNLENRHLSLKEISIAKVSNLQTILDSKVDAEEGSRLIHADEISKLQSLKNCIIESVDDNNFSISEDKQLNLNKIEINQVTGLQDLLDGKVNVEEGKGLSSNDYTNEDKQNVASIPGLSATIGNLNSIIFDTVDPETEEITSIGMVTEISNLKSVVNNLSSNMGSYVTVSVFNETVNEINNDILELSNRLSWTDLTE